ncbi:hypothetical protein SH2C18_00860 [Clostridium sediminicola]|uniref:DUF6951 family protein n=1 Tax=Clostridium sediminicola TaxID=3114879 RepID=UPI0031F255E7
MKLIINAGICGFNTEVNVSSEDMQNAIIEIKTECPSLKPLEKEIKEVDGFTECFGKVGDTEIYKIIRNHCPHAACPVASGIIKAIEVSCGLALPHDVEMKFISE